MLQLDAARCTQRKQIFFTKNHNLTFLTNFTNSLSHKYVKIIRFLFIIFPIFTLNNKYHSTTSLSHPIRTIVKVLTLSFLVKIFWWTLGVPVGELAPRRGGGRVDGAGAADPVRATLCRIFYTVKAPSLFRRCFYSSSAGLLILVNLFQLFAKQRFCE